MSVNKMSVKVSEGGVSFLKNVRLNRIKVDCSELNSYDESIELIAKYFKNNNNEYIQMLKTNLDGEEQ